MELLLNHLNFAKKENQFIIWSAHLSELAGLLNGLPVDARPGLREALVEHLPTLHTPPPAIPLTFVSRGAPHHQLLNHLMIFFFNRNTQDHLIISSCFM